MSAPIALSKLQALRQAETAAPDPYRPSAAYVAATAWCVAQGYMEKGQLGGFYLVPAGRRVLAANPRAKA